MYKTVNSEIVYKGKIIDVTKDIITLPDGREASREVVLHSGAAAIVPVLDNGDIVFVRQYRHPAIELVLEIPAGTFEKSEEPFICAKRELEEETGYYSDNITFAFKMFSAIGFCDEVLHIYIAKDLKQSKQNLDPDEFITIETYPLQKAIDMIFSGEIKDSKTIAGILAYRELSR